MSHTNIIGGKCPLPRYRASTRISWHAAGQYPTGTRVYDVYDGRHVGRLEAVLWSGVHRVKFDNGTFTDVPKHRIRKAGDGE